MKRLLTYFIGLVIVFSGIHFVPAHAMMYEMDAMSHCSLCSEEDLDADRCKPPLENSKSDTQVSSPVANDCDCNLDSTENNHHTGIIQSQIQQSKGKTSLAVWFQPYFELHNTETFLSSKIINAPPVACLQNLITVRQLK